MVSGTPSTLTLAPGQHGAFAVVKLWPGIQVAEDEVIARLELAARRLGLRCIPVHPDGRPLAGGAVVNSDTVDFVLNLHFEQPKSFDVFSFLALWNPVDYYHDYIEGSYHRFVDNILSHDDYISCASTAADDHIRRLITRDGPCRAPHFELFHSVPRPFGKPTIGSGKLFFAGINWERLTKRKTRHGELLEILDRSGMLRLYGPRELHGVRVWEGFQSYVDELPFDGVSVLKAAANAGISLVLSSDSHKRSGIMSSRLFESIGSGAVVIADDHPFAREHFGDSLYYFEPGTPEEEAASILALVDEIRSNPDEALARAARAQAILGDRFALDASIARIYEGLDARKAALETPRPVAPAPLTMFFLVRHDGARALAQHAASLRAQAAEGVDAVLLVDRASRLSREEFEASPDADGFRWVDWDAAGGHVPYGPLTLGDVLARELRTLPAGGHFMVIGETEQLFAGHVRALRAALAETPEGWGAVSSFVCGGMKLGDQTHVVKRHVATGMAPDALGALGRFLLPVPTSDVVLTSGLPYFDHKAMNFCASLLPGIVTSPRPTLRMRRGGLSEEVRKQVRIEDERLGDMADLPDAVPAPPPPRGALDMGRDDLAHLLYADPGLVTRAAFDGLPLPRQVRTFAVGGVRAVRGAGRRLTGRRP